MRNETKSEPKRLSGKSKPSFGVGATLRSIRLNSDSLREARFGARSENSKNCNLRYAIRNAQRDSFTPLEKKFLSFDRTKKYIARMGVRLQDPDRHHTNFPAGFTLLELIISLSILSLVTLIIGSSFSLGLKAWEKGENVAQETQGIRTLRDMIFKDIKSAYPYKMKIEGENVIVFKGSNDSIMFVTAFVNPSAGGFRWVKYSFDNEGLMFKDGILPDKNLIDKSAGKEEIFDSNIGKIEFMYLASDKDKWEDSWDLGEKFPVAVKIKIASLQPLIIRFPVGLVNINKSSDMLDM